MSLFSSEGVKLRSYIFQLEFGLSIMWSLLSALCMRFLVCLDVVSCFFYAVLVMIFEMVFRARMIGFTRLDGIFFISWGGHFFGLFL